MKALTGGTPTPMNSYETGALGQQRSATRPLASAKVGWPISRDGFRQLTFAK